MDRLIDAVESLVAKLAPDEDEDDEIIHGDEPPVYSKLKAVL